MPGKRKKALSVNDAPDFVTQHLLATGVRSNPNQQNMSCLDWSGKPEPAEHVVVGLELPNSNQQNMSCFDFQAAIGVRSNSQTCWSTETRNGVKGKRGRDVVQTPTQARNLSAPFASKPLNRAGFTMKRKVRSQG